MNRIEKWIDAKNAADVHKPKMFSDEEVETQITDTALIVHRGTASIHIPHRIAERLTDWLVSVYKIEEVTK